ncbi:MAG: hypothetical protein OH338_03450 [Candidatus Parvarchaeota archaeon]|nr:hypothetical protein [Candidatus Parvarchaeum tengchongense]MCW1312459.1 hypothetical protein [Candidatus Parvarchaeum tengchongense]
MKPSKKINRIDKAIPSQLIKTIKQSLFFEDLYNKEIYTEIRLNDDTYSRLLETIGKSNKKGNAPWGIEDSQLSLTIILHLYNTIKNPRYREKFKYSIRNALMSDPNVKFHAVVPIEFIGKAKSQAISITTNEKDGQSRKHEIDLSNANEYVVEFYLYNQNDDLIFKEAKFKLTV